MSSLPNPSLPVSFVSKKAKILASLSVPTTEYDDLSPKGSIDVGIRSLIDEINGVEGWVTTSSCAGRISVFLEGKKRSLNPGTAEEDELVGGGEEEQEEQEEKEKEETAETEVETETGRETRAGVGGKGGGGRWLFVSHDAVEEKILEEEGNWAGFLGMEREECDGDEREQKKKKQRTSGPKGHPRDIRFIHFKFEPMILHILTSSLTEAQSILGAAFQAGFRESGALGLTGEAATPMVGIRSMGLALESLVGYEVDGRQVCNVPQAYLKTLLQISSERFAENTKRIQRFRRLLLAIGTRKRNAEEKEAGWEDAATRRERKREEGLKRSLALREEKRRAEEEGKVIDLTAPDENI
ncbi:tRNA wybutosine-synthesizing protein [Phlyctema vagabunda]|uniref:tRNA(Phe) 7-[(3-amino-3-carboxypropyl)-4-demethylwyosine(37)-N(4)]-methyltransferase n=1 Tax=Phlyctema vagabunda TaxID=108571 RepID=A0ABR4PT46_9HELO